MRPIYTYIAIFTFLVLLIQPSAAQELESDPEVKDIRARVVDFAWTLGDDEYFHDEGATEFQFTITIELWNPYNEALTSYGSSSCRWSTLIDAYITPPLPSENYFTCTSDYAPRTYVSGLSNETVSTGLVFANSDLNELPDGSYYISAGPHTYFNQSDYYFGVNMTISNSEPMFEYESYPLNWGDILFNKPPSFDLPYNFLSTVAAIGFLSVIIKYSYQKRIMDF